MHTKKITLFLILLSVVVSVLDLSRLDIWGAANLLYLIWNLCLAWIPYIISLFFFKKDLSLKLFLPLFIIWLLFFPNAPYLVTDVEHISAGSPALWYDSLLYFFFGWIGLMLGVLSLSHVHSYLRARMEKWLSELCIICICFVSSFGIYLGRFERWNSWDVFLDPLSLIRHFTHISASTAHSGAIFLIVMVFTVFIYAVYKTMCVFLNDAHHCNPSSIEVESN